MKNPIFNELKKFKLIKNSNLITLNNKTRDKRIRVIKDLKTKVIFLEKQLNSKDTYNSKDNYRDYLRKDRKINKKKKSTIKLLHSNVRTPILDDDLRRSNQFKRWFKNKNILDFGCGWGGFLRNIKNYKSLSGIELRRDCIKHINNNIQKI